MASALKMVNKNTYNDFFGTLNEQEYNAAEWALKNVPASNNITVVGIPHTQAVVSTTSKKIRWLAAVSQHVTRFYELLDNKEEITKRHDWHIMLDYTMATALNDKETLNYMQGFEKNVLTNHTLVYDKNSIRVYKLEPKNQ